MATLLPNDSYPGPRKFSKSLQSLALSSLLLCSLWTPCKHSADCDCDYHEQLPTLK